MFAAKRKPGRAQPQVISSKVNRYPFGSRTRKERHWKEKSTMATLLSRIFGKKTVEPAPVQIDNNELDTRALKPLMERKAPVSTDPKDLSGAWTMDQVTTVFPSAQRALFQKYHVGGCSSCGFMPHDTLDKVSRDHGLETDKVVAFIKESANLEKKIEITTAEVAALLKKGAIKVFDVRAAQED